MVQEQTRRFAPTTGELARTRRLYRWTAPLYDPFRAAWSRWTRPAEAALDRLFRERIGAETRILELAPGTGINLERLFRCAPGFRSYLGVDSSPEMLERARRRAGGDPRIRLVLGDATRLEGIASAFDFIVCTWLLSHLDDPEATVRQAVEKLAEGGSAVFLFFSPPRARPLRSLLRALGQPGQYRFVDPESLVGLPHLESLESHAGRMATVAVFSRPVLVSVGSAPS